VLRVNMQGLLTSGCGDGNIEHPSRLAGA